MKTNRISVLIAFFLFSIFILNGPDLSGQTEQESKKETKAQKKLTKQQPSNIRSIMENL